MGYSALKTCGCDLLVQTVVEKREEIDWRRNAAFGTFGLVYLGGVQYALYVPIFSRLFPAASAFAAQTLRQKVANGPGCRSLFGQVFLDQFVHHPLLYFPVFYMIKDAVTSDSPSPSQAISSYTENMSEDLKALWKIWVPSTILNFAFMPMWARIPWVATTSAIWTCILSAMRGGGSTLPSPGVIGPHVDAATFDLFHRKLVAPTIHLDPAQAHVLVTLCGPDQPGIMMELSRIVLDEGGMVTTSKAMKLGTEFSIMMHVACPPDSAAALEDRLHVRTVKGCNTTAHRLECSAKPSAPLYTAEFRLTGPDRPGLIHKLSVLMHTHGLNIETLQSEQHVLSDIPAEPLFTLNGILSGPAAPTPALSADLRQLQEELGVVCEITQRSAV